MGWFPCTKCGRKDWRMFEHPKGCNHCNVTICINDKSTDNLDEPYLSEIILP